MNLKKNNEKKDLVIKMVTELAKLSSEAPLYVNKKMDYLLRGFLQETIDFENGIRYIDNVMINAKDEAQKIFWIQVVKTVKNYFETSKKLK